MKFKSHLLIAATLLLCVSAPGAFAAAGGGVVVGIGGGGNANAPANEPNEVAAMAYCRAFAEAEEIYHRTDYMREGVLQYAQVLAGRAEDFKRIRSEPLKIDPPSADEQKKIETLIKALDDDDFAAREKATTELMALGAKAYPQVQKALASASEGEVAQRGRRIVDKINEANATPPKVKVKYRFGLLGSNGGGELALIDRRLAGAECAAGCDPSQSNPAGGYFFRVLTRQGEAATGGKRDYIVGDKMTLGYALLAFPAAYGATGKKCFMINNNGTTFERDFGSKEATDAFVKDCIEFNPTKEWKAPE